jgi:hypothetical protein
MLNIFIEPDFTHFRMMNIRISRCFISTEEEERIGEEMFSYEHFLFGFRKETFTFQMNQSDHIFVEIDHWFGHIEGHR